MPKTIDLEEIAPRLAVQFEALEEPVYLRNHGRRVGVVVSPEWYELDARSRLLIDELDKASSESELIPEDEVDADIEQAIREVRTERR